MHLNDFINNSMNQIDRSKEVVESLSLVFDDSTDSDSDLNGTWTSEVRTLDFDAVAA